MRQFNAHLLSTALLLLGWHSTASATVAPKLSSLVDRSDWIVTGKVVHAEKPSQTYYLIRVDVQEFLHSSSLNPVDATGHLEYRQPILPKSSPIVLGPIQNSHLSVFFLKESHSGELTLVDSLFGAQKASTELFAELRAAGIDTGFRRNIRLWVLIGLAVVGLAVVWTIHSIIRKSRLAS